MTRSLAAVALIVLLVERERTSSLAMMEMMKSAVEPTGSRKSMVGQGTIDSLVAEG